MSTTAEVERTTPISFRRIALILLALVVALLPTVVAPQQVFAAETEPTARATPTLPITVEPCVGETPRATRPVTLKEGGKTEQALLDGKIFFIHDNTGYLNVERGPDDDNDAPVIRPGQQEEMGDSSGQGGLPYCGAHVLEDGSVESFWTFCTNKDQHGCMSDLPSEQTGQNQWDQFPDQPVRVLDETQRAKIAQILSAPKTATALDRKMTQTQVWCVSEGIEVGTVYEKAQEYFAMYQGGLDDEQARCQEIISAPVDPMLTLEAEQDVITAEDTARFTLKTNILTPLQISTERGEPVELCPASQQDVSFAQGNLTFDKPGTARLCVNSDTPGDVILYADSGPLASVGDIMQSWNGDTGCQVFNSYVKGDAISRSAEARTVVIGQGTFDVKKTFTGVDLTDEELANIAIDVSWTAMFPDTIPANVRPTAVAGKLQLNQANNFSAVGPTMPAGTVITLFESWAGNDIPVGVEWEGAVWTVDGVPSTQPHTVTISEDTSNTVNVVIANELAAAEGTFSVVKSFDGATPGPDASVTIGWRSDATAGQPSRNGTFVLNQQNNFQGGPQTAAGEPITFVLGTRVVMWEESSTGYPAGIVVTPEWGANSAGVDDQDRPLGSITIAQSYVPGDAGTIAPVYLNNEIDNQRVTMGVAKRISVDGGAATVPSGEFAGLTVGVRADWTEAGQAQTTTVGLNQANQWQTGLGRTFAPGTEVTLAEDEVRGVPADYEAVGMSWDCTSVTGPCRENTDGSITVTATVGQAPVLTATNAFALKNGSFVVRKQFAVTDDQGNPVTPNTGDFDDVEIEIEYSAAGDDVKPADQNGTLTLRAPDFSAQGPDLPVGTVVTLLPEAFDDASLPTSLEWDSASWSPAGPGGASTPPVITIGATGPTDAVVTLTNSLTQITGTFEVNKSFAELPEGVETADLEVTVAWSAETGESGTVVLNEANNWSTLPFVGDPATCDVQRFPLGTHITFTETTVTGLPAGVTIDQDWGADQIPGTNPPQGMLTIAEQWNGCDDRTSASSIEVTNGSNDERTSVLVRKFVSDGATTEAPSGDLDGLEITVLAEWGTPVQSETLLLTQANQWQAGVGQKFAPGTAVTLTEVGIAGTPDRFDWDTVAWECTTVAGTCAENTNGSITVTTVAATDDATVATITAVNAYELVEGFFDLEKVFTLVDNNGNPIDLDSELLQAAQIVVGYTATGAGVKPADESGTLTLRYPDFADESPSFPRGTVVELEPEEFDTTALPFQWRWDDAVWNPAGAAGADPATPPSIVIADTAANLSVTLTNALTQLYGTFDISKTFDGELNYPGVAADVTWVSSTGAQSPSDTPITLSDANGYHSAPIVAGETVLFPLGTVVELTETEVRGLPVGVRYEPDWGTNAKPEAPEVGQVTIMTEGDGGDTATLNAIGLDNDIIDERSTITVKKTVDTESLGLGSDSSLLADLVVLVDASWSGSEGEAHSERLLLNAANEWQTGLGHLLPLGTQVTLSESRVVGGGPSVIWNDAPTWNCDSASENSGCDPQPDGSVIATVGLADELAVEAVNAGTRVFGSFAVQKFVEGDVTIAEGEDGSLEIDDPRLEQAEFVVQWAATGAELAEPTSGELVLNQANQWQAQPVDAQGTPLVFPLGTVIDLTEVQRPENIPGLNWDEDLTWSIGQAAGGTSSQFTIVDRDTVASISLTNYSEINEGTFSIEKLVQFMQGTVVPDDSFTVKYTDGASYNGELVVRNGETVQAPVFPLGTLITLSEITPAAPADPALNWAEPVFVIGGGAPQTGSADILIGDGTSVAVQLTNVLETTPSEPVKPGEPTRPGLAITGADSFNPVPLVMGVLLLGAMLTIIAALRSRKSRSEV